MKSVVSLIYEGKNSICVFKALSRKAEMFSVKEPQADTIGLPG